VCVVCVCFVCVCVCVCVFVSKCECVWRVSVCVYLGTCFLLNKMGGTWLSG
jgi:hypothetical protein